MYPERELIRLAGQKALLRRDIALRRAQCAEAASRVTQTLAWLDRMVAFWRRLPPLAQFAAVPLGFLVKRTLFSRVKGFKLLGALVRWGPLAFGAIRSMRAAAKSRA